ncbi:MAG: HmuY family protein [Bacteroidota bacterium]
MNRQLSFVIGSMAWIFVVLGSSCFRPDTPIAAPEIDDSEVIQQVAMGAWNEALNGIGYHNQVFLDLETGTMTSVERTSWDVGFEASNEGHHVILNTSNYMQAAATGSNDFATVWTESEAQSLSFDFDSASGVLAHTRLAEWWSPEQQLASEEVYIIDRGRDLDLKARGYQKLQLLEVTSAGYTFRYGALDDPEGQLIQLDKNPSFNWIHFSMEMGTPVSVQPPKTDWDLQFSYYSFRFPDGFPYYLTGVLTNRYQVRSAEILDETKLWEELSLADTTAFPFRSEIDEIGYDWKVYLFGPPAGFVVDSDRFFLVKDTEGLVYAIRFLDFYNAEGQKGFPQFTYRILTP